MSNGQPPAPPGPVDPNPPLSTADAVKSAGSIIVTILLFIVVGFWMWFVAKNLGKTPTYNADGSVKLDEYSRAKDVLVIFIPLLTTAVGFWFGSQGTVQAQKQTAVANQTAAVANDHAHQAGVREKLILDASSQPDLLSKAAEAARSQGLERFW